MCAACPWSRAIPAWVAELLRRYHLLELGVTIRHEELTGAEAQGLLVIHECYEQRRADAMKPPPEAR